MNIQSQISFFFSSTNYSSVLELNVCTVGPRVQHFFSLISSFIVRLYLSSGHVWFPENPSRQKLFLTDSSSNRSGSNLKDMNEIGQINIVNLKEKKPTMWWCDTIMRCSVYSRSYFVINTCLVYCTSTAKWHPIKYTVMLVAGLVLNANLSLLTRSNKR